jgi:hypothetical protein
MIDFLFGLGFTFLLLRVVEHLPERAAVTAPLKRERSAP